MKNNDTNAKLKITNPVIEYRHPHPMENQSLRWVVRGWTQSGLLLDVPFESRRAAERFVADHPPETS